MKKPRTRDSIIHTARSLRELAQRGEDGEQSNARAKYEAFMARHGLRDDELGTGHVRDHVFAVPQHWQWLFIQVASTVLGDIRFMPKPDSVTLPCAEEDVPHIWSKFERYRDAYQEDEMLMRMAFIHVQQLSPRTEPLHPPVSNAPKPTMRPEDETGTAFDPPPAPPAHSEPPPDAPAQEPYPNPERRGLVTQLTDMEVLKMVVRKVSYRIPIGPMADVPVSHG